MSLGESIAEAAVPGAEATDPAEISHRLSTMPEENSEENTTDNDDDDQQAFLNFAGEYFPGADLEAVKVVYEACSGGRG